MKAGGTLYCSRHAHAAEPDLLQLDVVWTPESAAAGWLLPLDRFSPPAEEFSQRHEDHRDDQVYCVGLPGRAPPTTPATAGARQPAVAGTPRNDIFVNFVFL